MNAERDELAVLPTWRGIDRVAAQLDVIVNDPDEGWPEVWDEIRDEIRSIPSPRRLGRWIQGNPGTAVALYATFCADLAVLSGPAPIGVWLIAAAGTAWFGAWFSWCPAALVGLFLIRRRRHRTGLVGCPSCDGRGVWVARGHRPVVCPGCDGRRWTHRPKENATDA